MSTTPPTVPTPEQRADALAPSPAVAAPAAAQKPPKTSGEKFYDIFQFVFGKAFILAITAVLAFGADQKYAPDKVMGVPNYLKKFQGWFHEKVFYNKVFPISEKGPALQLIGGAAVSTMVLSHGGNFFAPFIKWLENSKESIANAYNKQFGKPGEVEQAHERLKDNPKQNWGDVIKGRLVAWATVFGVMVTTYLAVGKDKKSGRYWLDIYEDKFARVLSGVLGTPEGKAIAAVPMSTSIAEAGAQAGKDYAAHSHYRFGKIAALDIFATTGGIILWNIFSRLSAKKRAQHQQTPAQHSIAPTLVQADEAAQAPTTQTLAAQTPAAQDAPQTSYTDKFAPPATATDHAAALEHTRTALPNAATL